jgi:hypothetical protein
VDSFIFENKVGPAKSTEPLGFTVFIGFAPVFRLILKHSSFKCWPDQT